MLMCSNGVQMVYVTKYNGKKQNFEKEKIIRTCIRMGATPEIATTITNRIEGRIYDGIHTKEIMKMIFSYMRKYRPEIKHTINLRKAITMLRPKPDFELFVAKVLEAHGYKVKSNQYVNGRCVEYEIDAIATKVKGKGKGKVGDVIYVEVKHHYKPHTYTSLDVFLENWAKYEDLKDGYKARSNKIKFNKVMIVSNTKFSDHATKYAKCKGMEYIGWKAPVEYGLEQMIEKKKLHPITFLKELDSEEQRKLGDAGIVTIKQILNMSIDSIARKTKIPKKRLTQFKTKGRQILSS